MSRRTGGQNYQAGSWWRREESGGVLGTSWPKDTKCSGWLSGREWVVGPNGAAYMRACADRRVNTLLLVFFVGRGKWRIRWRLSCSLQVWRALLLMLHQSVHLIPSNGETRYSSWLTTTYPWPLVHYRFLCVFEHVLSRSTGAASSRNWRQTIKLYSIILLNRLLICTGTASISEFIRLPLSDRQDPQLIQLTIDGRANLIESTWPLFRASRLLS